MKLSDNRTPAQSRGTRSRRTRVTSEEIYRELEYAILIGNLQPRERLVEADVCQKLSASRTLVREVFRRMEGVGLIKLSPNCGATVRDFTRDEVEEVYFLRMLLEKAAVPLICRHVTRGDLAGLRALNQTFADACVAGDMPKMIQGNLEFHRRLTAVTRNVTLQQFLEISRLQTHQARYIVWADERSVERSLQEHEEMLAALGRRDARTLKAVILRHIARGKRDYHRIFGRQEERLLGVSNRTSAGRSSGRYPLDRPR